MKDLLLTRRYIHMKKKISKVTTWYFSKGALPYWYILLIDSCFVLTSGMLIYALTHGTLFTLTHFGSILATQAFYLLFYLIGFRLLHTYSGIIRYSSFVDLHRVGWAVLIGVVLSLFSRLLPFVHHWLIHMGALDIVLTGVVAALQMWAIRVVVKVLYDESSRIHFAKRVFIYGVKEGGIGLAKSIKNQPESPYTIAGFVDDDLANKKHLLMGVHVYLNDDDLVEHMQQQNTRILLVSPLKSEAVRANTEMVNRLIENRIKIFMMPSAREWNGKDIISHQSLKEVDIEDLLPRDKIEIDLDAVHDQLKDKRVLITGAAGSIGSEMVRQIAAFGPKELVLIDQAETPLHDIRLMMARDWPALKALTIVTNICNEARMDEIFHDNRPEYVFHAAAYKHVPMMEDNPGESIRNNVDGTRIIADLAVKYGTRKFVMVSTDKAVNPTNVMGCSKRICEIYVQSLDKAIKDGKVKGVTQFVTTRFGNVLGSNGSVIPLFKNQIKSGGPVTVTHPDIIRFFMLIPEACKLVLEAGTMGNGGEIFVFDMGKPVKIVDLAKRMIALSGAKNVEIKFTGLRDGEKLYEEVLNEEEVSKPTFHPKIKVAQVREYDYREVNEVIEEMILKSSEESDMEIVKRMKELVPEFISKHSKYEVLDR